MTDDRFDLPPMDFGDENEELAPSDPRFDAWLAKMAPSANEPPPTPKLEMWGAIAAANRANFRNADASPFGGTTISPLGRMTSFRRSRYAWPAVAAAALILGIGLDRLLIAPRSANEATRQQRVATTKPQSQPAPVASTTTDSVPSTEQRVAATTSGSASPSEGRETTRSATSPAGRATQLATRSNTKGAEQPEVPLTSHRSPLTVDPRRDAGSADANSLYRMAARQTLTQAEALLTAYKSSGLAATNPAAARQLGAWGRDVLSSTRLLLDSPAGDDAELRPLLHDLELVLVQIIRQSGAPLDSTDRTLIDRAMRERDLLPRIRTAVPAGVAGAASED